MIRPTRITSLSCLVVVGLLAFASQARAQAAAGATIDNVVLVTLDGPRVEEIFGGLDRAVLEKTKPARERLEETSVYERYWAPTPEERRERLMPFLWRTLVARHGTIAGNAARGSRVGVANRHRFSYPGYAEILTGEAHDEVINSNEKRRIPFQTVLEFIKTEKGLRTEEVASFASWDAFDWFVEREPGSITSNAGFEPYDHPDPATRALSAAQFETPVPWETARHDWYTFRFAMAHLATHRPRVLYIAFDETDDWAHQGKYDRYLDAINRADRYLEELWTWLQNDERYRNRTALVVAVDHGRGRTPDDWDDHGATVEGAQDTWIAFAGPGVAARGEWVDHPPLTNSQIAATICHWLGLDFRASRPAAGAPVRFDTTGVAASLSDVAFMAGHWVGGKEGEASEEIWTAPAGDSMLGMWRLVAQGQVRVMEVLVLKQEGDRVVLRFRHFDPGLVAWEDKETPIVLTLTRRATGEARFEGPAVGAPGTIALTYRRTGPDRLEATLERGGRTDRFSFTRKR